MRGRIERGLIRRAACAVDAADRAVARAWRRVMTPEERMAVLSPEDAPARATSYAGLTRSCFMYADITVPPGITLDVFRRMRRP